MRAEEPQNGKQRLRTSGWRALDQNLGLESIGSEPRDGEHRIRTSGWRAEDQSIRFARRETSEWKAEVENLRLESTG